MGSITEYTDRQIGDRHMSDLLQKQIDKLAEMEQQFLDLLGENPLIGHGGTPFVDNAHGRMQRKRFDKYQDSLRSLNAKIEEQKEKIERTKSRNAFRSTVTKKSAKFTEKNPIHPYLLELAEQGKVKQWVRNPHIFFVAGLDKVALTTFGEKIGVNSRFPAKSAEDWAVCNELMAGGK